MRRTARLLVGLIVSLSVLVASTTSASAASSAQALANPANAWIAAELAGTAVDAALITDPQGKLDPVLWTSMQQPTGSRSVPVTTSKSPAVNIKPRLKAPGIPGLILNTGAVILTVAGLGFGSEDKITLTPESPQPPPAEGGPTQVVGFSSHTVPAPGFLSNEVSTHGAWRWRTAPSLASGWTYSGTQQWRSSASFMTRPDGRAVIGGSDVNSVTENCWRSGLDNAVSLYKAPLTGVASDGLAWTQTSPRIFQNPRVPYVDITCFAAIVPVGGGTQAQATITHRVYNPDSPPPSTEPEPFQATTTVECIDAAGVITELTSSTTVTGGGLTEWIPPSVTCPTGQVAKSGRVDGLIGGQVVPLVPRTTSPDWVQTLPQLGADTSGSTAPALWTNIGTEASPQWVTCASRPDLCRDWYKLPSAQQTAYRCQIGTVVVARDACGRHNTSEGAVVVDLPAPRPDAAAPVGGPPGPTDVTCPPTVTATSFFTGRVAYDAIVCAFVPREPVAAKFDGIGANVMGAPPVSWVTGVGDFLSPPGGPAVGAGAPVGGLLCPDWVVTVGDWQQNIVCDSSYIDALQLARPWITGAMIIVAFSPLIRSLWYATLPLVRPTPTGAGGGND